MNFNLSTTPVVLRLGLCLPIACTQNDFNQVGTVVSEKASGLVSNLLKTSLNPGLYFLPDDTSVELYFRKVEEYDEDDWLNIPYQRYGAGLMSGILIAIILTIIVASIKV